MESFIREICHMLPQPFPVLFVHGLKSDVWRTREVFFINGY